MSEGWVLRWVKQSNESMVPCYVITNSKGNDTLLDEELVEQTRVKNLIKPVSTIEAEILFGLTRPGELVLGLEQ